MEQIIKNSINLFNPYRVDEKPGYSVTVGVNLQNKQMMKPEP